MEDIKILEKSLTERITIPAVSNEYWYGGCVMDGPQYPFSVESGYTLEMITLDTVNQFAPIFVSTKGRAIWSEKAFNLYSVGNNFEISATADVYLYEGGSCLKDAQKVISKEVYTLGEMPPKEFFEMPQWNSWIELLYKQNEEDILKYAKGIIDNGLPAGIIMIDDLWADYYGRWKFSERKFPHAKELISTLHEMGFKVMVWVCPFVTPDTPEYHQLRDDNMLIKNKDGKPVIREWWNGYSAVLDLSNPKTYAWLKNELMSLQDDFGVDGFKFDAGDPRFYSNDDISYMGLSSLEQVELWSRFGLEFPFNEYRMNYKNQGAPLVNRLQDKEFEWGKNGLSELIPSTLAQGMLGYYFSCPDMIGGGEYQSFLGKTELDQELIVRSAQCSALMPMMQFSVAPWRVLDQEHLDLCKAAANKHVEYSEYIIELAENAAETGEPIVRPVAYDYPEADLRYSNTQFMLGSKVLVAPVLEKSAQFKEVYLPSGKWKNVLNQEVFSGPTIEKIVVDLKTIPVFEKVEE